jgi:hypothetical protein
MIPASAFREGTRLAAPDREARRNCRPRIGREACPQQGTDQNQGYAEHIASALRCSQIIHPSHAGILERSRLAALIQVKPSACDSRNGLNTADMTHVFRDGSLGSAGAKVVWHHGGWLAVSAYRAALALLSLGLEVVFRGTDHK